MKRVIALILALIMALSLVACGEKAPVDNEGESKIKDRLVIANGNMLSILDTHNNNDLWCGHVYSLVHSALVDIDFQTNEIKPELAYLDWAEGTYPTPKGEIYVKVTKNADGNQIVDIQAPKGIFVLR